LPGGAIAPGPPPPPAIPVAPGPSAAPSGPPSYGEAEKPITLEEVKLPGTAKTAALIWIVFGALIFFVYVSQLLAYAAFAAHTPDNRPRMVFFCLSGCATLFAAAFVIVGIQTLLGSAKDTLGNGIGSLFFGLLAAAGFLGETAPASREDIWDLATFFFRAASVAALLGAGLLALADREKYRFWQRSLSEPQRRRR
jgi:hypothetical protein